MKDFTQRPTHGSPVDDDVDVSETNEWLEALKGVARVGGRPRVRYLLQRLAEQANRLGVPGAANAYSLYQNSIALEQQPVYPGNLVMEERITSIIRWNALAMVARANKAYGELGGHIASYASAAEIFEVGFNHFFGLTVKRGGAIWFTSRPTLPPVSMRGPFSKGACRRRNSSATGKKCRAQGCAPIRIRG